MFRKSAWRNAASDAVSFHQGQALNTTIFLLKCFGPTGFLLREDREAKDFKVNHLYHSGCTLLKMFYILTPARFLVQVCLGDPHTCSCPVFTREQEPCKHICWWEQHTERDEPHSQAFLLFLCFCYFIFCVDQISPDMNLHGSLNVFENRNYYCL